MLILTAWPPAAANEWDAVRAAIAVTQALRESQALLGSAKLPETEPVLRLSIRLTKLVDHLESYAEPRSEARLLRRALQIHLATVRSLCSSLEARNLAGRSHSHYLTTALPQLQNACRNQAGATLYYALRWCQSLGVKPEGGVA